MRKKTCSFPAIHDDRENERKNQIVVTKPKSILEAFEQIVELARDSNLSPEFFTQADLAIKYARRRLHLSPIQIVLLSVFVDRSEDSRIMLSEIAGFLDCRTTKILRLANEIDVLESLHYVRASRSDRSLSYRVPGIVLDALRKNVPYVHTIEPIENLQGFFDHFNDLMRERDDDEITHDVLLQETREALDQIPDSALAIGLKRMDMRSEDKLLFIFMAHLFVRNSDNNIQFSDIDHIFDDNKIPSMVITQLRRRTSPLFDYNLIENVNEDGFARPDAFKLTEKAKEDFLGELNLSSMAKTNFDDLIKASTLSEKHLIYNASEASQIDRLAALLAPDRFSSVQDDLRAAGMRTGFCCIFYGSPGTGKTETVYQLARLTGRDIMRVDVDKIKSCWVGESEKNIKALFDRYRNICRQATLAPILLFNEADAVLGVRMEGAARAVDKMENSIQNIILQEMESLEGIMIATTNLTTNLDKAFERRFLYKILFEKPTVQARARIWQAMLPAISSADADMLAEEFDFSGGEIENVIRKHSIDSILSSTPMGSFPHLLEACRHERITSSRPRLGF